MLKNDQCWRCDVSCKSPTPKVCCSRCEVAYYCSETCKNRDLFRHQVDCQTATLKRTCSGCSKESSRLKQCGSCLQAWYCNQACLKKSWPAHKASCQKMTRNTREMSLNIKKLHDLVEFTPGTATVYYWGNIPAQDLIKFPLNEGSEYSKPISVLACGVGDPRNWSYCPSRSFQKFIKKSWPLSWMTSAPAHWPERYFYSIWYSKVRYTITSIRVTKQLIKEIELCISRSVLKNGSGSCRTPWD